MHDLSEPTKRLIELASFLCAGVAAVSLSQAALIVTICAGLMSLILGGVRLYDRLKYGRGEE